MIYNEYYILKCHLYLNLTYTDSCLMFFNFICKDTSNVRECVSRKIIFEILKQSKIAKRLNLSDKFWEQLKCKMKTLEK